MIHFVYAGDPDDGRIQSPYCITKSLYHFLRQKVGADQLRYYRWDAGDDIELGANDILLGHPHYDPNTTVQKAFHKQCRAKCLIHPFHHRRVADNWPFDQLARAADRIFAICGPYWYDSIGDTQFAHWRDKMVRVDMAVDPTIFPYVKTAFNNQRKLVYIGSSTPNKNLGILTKVMARMPKTKLHWYGGDSGHPLARLPNVHTTGWITLDRAAASTICAQTDIMVSVSDSDANPTTLLESMAWGLIVACTKESGYYNDPLFTELPLNDVPGTVAALQRLLATSTPELDARSRAGRHAIETRYTWDRFNQTVWDGLKDFL